MEAVFTPMFWKFEHDFVSQLPSIIHSFVISAQKLK